MPWHFGPFRLDQAPTELWCAEQPVSLRPKTLALLAYLVAHAGQMVTKDALLEAVWPETSVGDGVLKASVSELRKVFRDTPTASQWIATVHGRGYRFVAPVTRVEPTTPRETPATDAAPQPALPLAPMRTLPPAPLLIAREAELAILHGWYTTALQGTRQLGFITGEAGIGKTTLVDAFVAQLTGQAVLWVGQGQCVEQYGPGEAYLPLLEALGRLGRTPDGSHLVTRLRQQAPSWLLQLPALLAPGEAEALQRATAGATRERMLRELAEAVEGLTAAHPLLLVLEDLHWSDTATIEWLAYVARRRGPARLLVLGTYRPVEAIVRAHPVRAMVQELLVHGQGAELPLGEWAEAGVAAYLAQRGVGVAVPVTLAQILTARTEGHPLFLVAVVDELIRQGALRVEPAGWELVGGLTAVMGVIPPSIRHLLEHQVAQLAPTEQALLAAASVAGVEFAVAAVAAGLQQTDEDVETQCATLARQYHLIQARGTATWPDGTVTARYGFRHALYQELIYEGVPVSRRGRWHQQIGQRLEAGYGAQAQERATELALHFVHGRDAPRAVQYLRQAADIARARHAHPEAITHLTHALEVLRTLPDTSERRQQELLLHVPLGASLMLTRGPAAPEVEQVYSRAYALCQQGEDTAPLLPVLAGLQRFYLVRAAHPRALELGERLLRLAERFQEPAFLLEAHGALGATRRFLGQFDTALTHQKEVIARYAPRGSRLVGISQDLHVAGLASAAHLLWCLGFADQALVRGQEALACAQHLGHPYSLMWCQQFVADLYQWRGAFPAAQQIAEASLTLATTQGFQLWAAQGTLRCGLLRAQQGSLEAGISQMQQGLKALRTTGAILTRAYFLIHLAEAYLHTDHPATGLVSLSEALTLMETTSERWWEAEGHRVHGELLLVQAHVGGPEPGALCDGAAAEACFGRALTLARSQAAKSLELRAAISLSRLWQQQGKRAAARDLLAPIYGWFTEGFDTADLQEAKALLESLAGGAAAGERER
jgi:predicted ATPase/DNA-binding winged helix-turn-helix (wHTH) protein